MIICVWWKVRGHVELRRGVIAFRRMYVLSSARFPQVDPFFGGAGDRQSWNPYIYVLNPPVGSSAPPPVSGVEARPAGSPWVASACRSSDLHMGGLYPVQKNRGRVTPDCHNSRPRPVLEFSLRIAVGFSDWRQLADLEHDRVGRGVGGIERTE